MPLGGPPTAAVPSECAAATGLPDRAANANALVTCRDVGQPPRSCLVPAALPRSVRTTRGLAWIGLQDISQRARWQLCGTDRRRVFGSARSLRSTPSSIAALGMRGHPRRRRKVRRCDGAAFSVAFSPGVARPQSLAVERCRQLSGAAAVCTRYLWL